MSSAECDLSDVAVQLKEFTQLEDWEQLLVCTPPQAASTTDDSSSSSGGDDGASATTTNGDARLTTLRTQDARRVHVTGRGTFLRAVEPNSHQPHSGTHWLFEIKAAQDVSPEASHWRSFDAFVLELCRQHGAEWWKRDDFAHATSGRDGSGFVLQPMFRTFRRDAENVPPYIPLVAYTPITGDKATPPLPLIQIRDATGRLLWPSASEDGSDPPLVSLPTAINLMKRFPMLEYDWALDGLAQPAKCRAIFIFGYLTTVTLVDFDLVKFLGRVPSPTLASRSVTVECTVPSVAEASTAAEAAGSDSVQAAASQPQSQPQPQP
jgi:hypothetical protein